MNKLPQEHIVKKSPAVEAMEIGDVRWLKGVQTTEDGSVWIQKTAETHTDSGWDEKRQYYSHPYKVCRLADGWKVSIPKAALPMEARFGIPALETVCFLVTELEITDDA